MLAYRTVEATRRHDVRWPGYLDNTVAGGISSGISAFEALVKECKEEASIEASVVKKYARSAGSISYFLRLR